MLESQQCALIGNPITHSLSPKIHAMLAERTGIRCEYIKIEPPINGFARAAQIFFDQGGLGCNVTLPFKIEAFQWAHTVSVDAQYAGAVNCLTRIDHKNNNKNNNKNIVGDNFDGRGLIKDLLNHHHYTLHGRDILILGAGGAVRGILKPIINQRPRCIVIANRTVDTAITLAKACNPDDTMHTLAMGVGWDAIPHRPFHLIIHATASGHLTTFPALSPAIINKQSFCYDLSYGPAAAVFLDWAKQHGAQHCSDGLGMLVEQALLTFEHWHKPSTSPDTRSILATLRKETVSSTFF